MTSRHLDPPTHVAPANFKIRINTVGYIFEKLVRVIGILFAVINYQSENMLKWEGAK
jgi:hypothetical protein